MNILIDLYMFCMMNHSSSTDCSVFDMFQKDTQYSKLSPLYWIVNLTDKYYILAVNTLDTLTRKQHISLASSLDMSQLDKQTNSL